jgi:2-methylcitrate dehydratase PrpD
MALVGRYSGTRTEIRVSSETHRLSRRREISQEVTLYIGEALNRDLPREVSEAASLHLLDTVAAIISGTTLPAYRNAHKFLESERNQGPATVIGMGGTASATLAAFVNGVSAHADETDDNHRTLVHAGCAVVPAALALAERKKSSGQQLLRAVTLGYDIAVRMALALGPDLQDPRRNPANGCTIGASFGAAAAAGALTQLSIQQLRYLWAYAAYQAGGNWSFLRDPSHVGKAVAVGGLPARNGVWAAELVQSGFTAENDALDGEQNFLESLSKSPEIEQLAEGLGERWEILNANIKRYPVGGPLQVVAEAVHELIAKRRYDPSQIVSIDVEISGRDRFIVNNRTMSDIDAGYIVASMILDGKLTFQATHDYSRMHDDAAIADLRRKVRLIADNSVPIGTRVATVHITDVNGRKDSSHVTAVRGSAENPMSRQEVDEKARDLILPVVGTDKCDELLAIFRSVENLDDLGPISECLRAIVVPESREGNGI